MSEPAKPFDVAAFYRERVQTLEGLVNTARWDLERAQKALGRFDLMLERARAGLEAQGEVSPEALPERDLDGPKVHPAADTFLVTAEGSVIEWPFDVVISLPDTASSVEELGKVRQPYPPLRGRRFLIRKAEVNPLGLSMEWRRACE